jgi:hypothetical protein
MESLLKDERKWYVIACLFLIAFLFTPVGLYNTLGFFLSIFEGLVCCFFVFLGIVKIKRLEDIYDLNSVSYPNLNKPETKFALVLALIISVVIISSICSERIESKLIKHGVVTQATIEDGLKRTYDSNISYKIKLTFKVDDNQIYVEDKVSDEIYNNLGRGQVVDIIYLPKHPKIVRILVGNENIKKYLHISNSYLIFNDLEELIVMNSDSIKSFLNKKSYKWVKAIGLGDTMFVNENKREMVQVLKNSSLVYACSGLISPKEFFSKVDILDEKIEKIDDPTDPASKLKQITTISTSKYTIQYFSSFNVEKREIELNVVMKLKSADGGL